MRFFLRQIKALIKKYIQRQQTINLVVVPCNVDIATTEALSMAQEVDPEGDRTIGEKTEPSFQRTGRKGETSSTFRWSRKAALLETRAIPHRSSVGSGRSPTLRVAISVHGQGEGCGQNLEVLRPPSSWPSFAFPNHSGRGGDKNCLICSPTTVWKGESDRCFRCAIPQVKFLGPAGTWRGPSIRPQGTSSQAPVSSQINAWFSRKDRNGYEGHRPPA